MTPEKQRIAIAEACGWKKVDDGVCVNWMTKEGANWRPEPLHYDNDLNACHEMEKTLGAKYERLYGHYLANLTGCDNCGPYYHRDAACIAHSTAAQRAEAYLRTLGLWEEDE